MGKNDDQGPGNHRSALLAGLARLNGELSGWAASMPWWRLVVLFLVILLAASMIGDQLGLKHRRVIVTGNETVQIGPNGIHITRKAPAGNSPVDMAPPRGSESPAAAAAHP